MLRSHTVPNCVLSRQGEKAGLVADVIRALDADRVIFLVDGLDEVEDGTNAAMLAAVLTAHIEKRKAGALVTTRPQAVPALLRLGGSWTMAELAPLSPTQRHAMVRLWNRALARLEAPSREAVAIDAAAIRKATQFMNMLERSHVLLRLAETPLFLLAMMELQRRGQALPRSRFAALREIVAQLTLHQPQRRHVDSLVVPSRASDSRRRDRVIAEFAFALQCGALRGDVPDSAPTETVIDHAVDLIVQRDATVTTDEADQQARDIFQFGEERAGLLVKKAPGQLGFFHLALQEHLAARHLQQRSLDQRIAFVREHAGHSRWRDPILNLLFFTDSEHDVGRLVQAIAEANTQTTAETRAQELLSADAVFGDFGNDATVARPLASRCFTEIEKGADGLRLKNLLERVVDGLGSESVGALCRSKLAEWFPDRHGFSRGQAFRAMPRWDLSLRSACIEAAVRNLSCRNDYVSRPAADAIAQLASEPEPLAGRVISLLRSTSDTGTIAACLYALGRLAPTRPDVGSMAGDAKSASDPEIVIEALRLRAARGETDDGDFELFGSVAGSC